MALQNSIAEQWKVCPAVVMITPSAVDGPIDLKTWLENVKEQKFMVVFYCEHSSDKGHEPFEISVDRKWVVKVSPWLQCVVNIAAALDKTQVASAVVKEFPLPVHTKEMKALIEALGDEGKHRQTRKLRGGALAAIADMANKDENSKKWRDKMEPVVGENGRTKWVKKEFESSYRLEVEEGVYSA